MYATHMSKKEDFKRYWNPHRTFHIAPADGNGCVSLMIRKSVPTWIYRAVRYGELSRYVHDERGRPLVYNHWYNVVNILNRVHKVYARYENDGTEWTPEKYNKAWDGTLYGNGEEAKTAREMIHDPYCCWVKGYKAHFVLETAKGKREHFAYYKPIEVNND